MRTTLFDIVLNLLFASLLAVVAAIATPYLGKHWLLIVAWPLLVVGFIGFTAEAWRCWCLFLRKE